MNDRTEAQNESAPTTVEVQPGAAQTGRKTRRRLRNLAIVAGAIVMAIVAVAGFLVWSRTRSGAGRPVPAPRIIAGDRATASSPTQEAERAITISPEASQRAGIKIETVGEQLGGPSTGVGPLATGTVQANTYRSTPVVSLVGGIARRVSAELGENVRQGQTVAVIFSNELAMAQSRYLSAVADLEEHHKHHERTAKLVVFGAASREELEQATTKLLTAEAEMASQRQRLLLLGLSQQRVDQLKSSSQVSSEVSLPAPVSGTVISRSVNAGEVIGADKELLRVADLSSVWVIGQVYEKDLGQIRLGSGASITSDTYPGRVFRGRVSYVDPTIDTATRTVQVRVELANPGQVLKLGMFVNVAFATMGGSEAITPLIPKAAVQNLNNQQAVFVVTQGANVFVMRTVRVGLEVNGFFPVLEGLNVGDRIVTEGSFLLRAEWLKQHPAQ